MGSITRLTYCYPLYLSAILFQKRFFLTFFGIIVVASIGISQLPNNRIMERINVAQKRYPTLSRQKIMATPL